MIHSVANALSRKWCTMAAIVVIAAVMASSERWMNSTRTLVWTAGSVHQCETIDQVVSAVMEAKEMGRRVKGYGSGWSWSTTLAGDEDDVYIKLAGPLARSMTAEYSLDEQPSVVVGGGVLAFDLYLQLQPTGFSLEAKGNCLTAQSSQTMGGLLATNVHHSGTKTFYDVVEWIDVVTADGSVVRAGRTDMLFRLTIGGGGRTGIIVRVKFNLAPQRDTYQNIDTIQPVDNSFKAFFEGFVELTDGYEPNEFIGTGTNFGLMFVSAFTNAFSFQGKLRMAQPSDNPVVLPSNFGDLGFFARALLSADFLLDFLLPNFLYDAYYSLQLALFTSGAQPDREGKVGKDLDVAASSAATVPLKHQEVELYVPVDLMGQVGMFLDAKFAEGAYPYIRGHGLFFLRFVYGCESLTAANGVMSNGTMPNFVAVNIDGYQRSAWGKFNFEVNKLLADLSAAFPLKIRTHPGKYNPPLSPNPESQDVKDMI